MSWERFNEPDAPHAARPLPAPAGSRAMWAKPHKCRTCASPIEHVHAGVWRHAKS